ncbi:MAG: ketoacyl-ACP synthase III [Spirochaetaceae bacterium]|jgi:3-oxoacyl-[acyl-carrier-protein] synthase-3|nr:ketoacyl-ACP synthase III [Spirochaetaceae bacterium]
MKAYIKAIDYYLPQKTISNEDLTRAFPEGNTAKTAAKIGIAKRHIAAEDETAADLAAAAAEKLFRQGVDRKSIDYILFCTQNPDYLLPASACILQDRLGIPPECGALDFNQGCSGFVYGLSLAKGLIAAGIAKNVLLLTAETYSKKLHPQDRGNRMIFGDGAAAALIADEGIAEIGEFVLGTDGAGAKNLILKTGGARCPEKEKNVLFDENKNPLSADHIYMNGSEVFNFTLKRVPVLVNTLLEYILGEWEGK